MKKMELKKKLLAGSIAAVLTVGYGYNHTAEAAGIWDVVGGVINGVSAYNGALMSVLENGYDAKGQNNVAENSLKKEKADLNKGEMCLVDGIMNRLITKGNYVMDSHSLPFRWQVTNVKEINAYCTPYNYISVYRGLILAFNANEDELAAVLGHEMTHGLQHHYAHQFAKSTLQRYGAALFSNNNKDELTNDLVALSLNYNEAKNFILPSEEKADEGGFFLAVDAGYNPGGMAAEEAKFLDMINSKRLEESDSIFSPNDHPRTKHRLELAAKQLSEYGYGHVKVKDNGIYLDGKLFLTAEPTSKLLAAEQAYMLAGAIDKGFHTNRLAAMWNFKETPTGVDFLTDDPVYKILKDAVNKNKVGKKFEEMITAAYTQDSKTGNRDKIYAKEKDRLAQIEEQRKKEKENMKKRDVRESAECNADIYNDLHMPKLALMMADRVLSANSDEIYVHAIRGNSYAVMGEYDKALTECNQALAANRKDPKLYISRAKAYKLMGRPEEALSDCRTALLIDTNQPNAYKLQAAIFDAKGSHDEALNSYKNYKHLQPKANDIPDTYAAELK